MNDPTVSVVIPVRNGEHCIIECLKAVFSQSLKTFEVIVVDGGSQDKTIELAKQFPVKIVHEDHGSVGGARQVGIENSNGRYIAFTDADCIPERDWLKNLISEFDEVTVGVGGGVHNIGHSLWEKSIALATNTFVGSARSVQGRLFKEKRFVNSISGCNSIYRRETLLEIGGFNTTLSMNEETELNRRLSAKGKLTYTPNAVVFHDQRRGLKAFAKQMIAYGWGRGRLRLWDLQCIPPIVVPFLFLSFMFVGYLFPAFAVFYAAVLFGVGTKIAIKNSNSGYLISVPIVFLVEHASYTVGFWKGLFEGLRR